MAAKDKIQNRVDLTDKKPQRYDVPRRDTAVPKQFASEDKVLEYLAAVLVEAYFKQRKARV